MRQEQQAPPQVQRALAQELVLREPQQHLVLQVPVLQDRQLVQLALAPLLAQQVQQEELELVVLEQLPHPQQQEHLAQEPVLLALRPPQLVLLALVQQAPLEELLAALVQVLLALALVPPQGQAQVQLELVVLGQQLHQELLAQLGLQGLVLLAQVPLAQVPAALQQLQPQQQSPPPLSPLLRGPILAPSTRCPLCLRLVECQHRQQRRQRPTVSWAIELQSVARSTSTALTKMELGQATLALRVQHLMWISRGVMTRQK